MAADSKGPYEKFIEQLTDPWDWVAAGAGAIAGGITSAAVGHLDAGTSVGAGAVGAVTVRKAAAASFQGWKVKRRARGIERAMESTRSGPPLVHLLEELQRERTLWESGATSNTQFDARLDAIVDAYRKCFSSPKVP